ncbi:MAG: hypothetical protein ACP5HM_08110 [Anaerolineae bacterium]
MPKRSLHFIPRDQVEQMELLAAQAQKSLSRFAGIEVQYNATALQLLDEWIERHLRQFSTPDKRLMMIWGAFLGEVFRRRFSGDWAIEKVQHKSRLGVLCPRDNAGLLFIPVMDQVHRRLKEGLQASLVLYYTMKGFEIRGG